jgi:hypothetical protein
VAIPAKDKRTVVPKGIWRRLPILAGLLLLGILLAACQQPGESDLWGDTLQPDAGEIRGLTPEHRRGHPTALHLDTDTRQAYITMGGTIGRPDHRIAVVDLERGELLDHIEVGWRPLDLSVDPIERDRLLVAHAYSPSISVIDKPSRQVTQIIPAPHYLESITFTRDGNHLLASDRANDRLLVYNITRDARGYVLEEHTSIPTGPNPETVQSIPPPPGADWPHDRLIAVSDRHGGSITLIDLQTQEHRRIGTGGPPMALAARDGLLFVAGVGPGDGTPQNISGTPETGTADLESSLLVLDLRMGPLALQEDQQILRQRFISDTARPDNADQEARILGGALPRALHFDDHSLPPLPGAQADHNDTILWVSYHSSDQVQALYYHSPGSQGALDAGVLTTRSGTSGERLSHHAEHEPLGPGLLTDTVHGIFETPPGPRDIARLDDLLVVVAQYPEQLHITDLGDCPGQARPTAPCSTRTIDLIHDPVPYPSGDFERGQRLFASAFPSADQDRSAIMCHTDGLATGGVWALPHRDLHPMKIPRLDQVADNAPWLIDGSVTRPEDYLNAAAGDMLQVDEDDPHNLATAAQQRQHNQDPEATDASDNNDTGATNQTLEDRFPGATQRLRLVDGDIEDPEDWMRLSFAYLLGERRVPPPPPFITSPDGEDMRRGLQLFQDAQVGCASCHIGGGTTGNLLSQTSSQDIPKPPGTDRIKAPPLASVWDQESTGLLWEGEVPRVQSAILPTGHPCLIEGELGLLRPWHGDATGRTCTAIDTLAAYVRALEAQ